jgi:hypothetical protein
MFFSYTEKPEGSSRDIGKATVKKWICRGKKIQSKEYSFHRELPRFELGNLA